MVLFIHAISVIQLSHHKSLFVEAAHRSLTLYCYQFRSLSSPLRRNDSDLRICLRLYLLVYVDAELDVIHVVDLHHAYNIHTRDSVGNTWGHQILLILKMVQRRHHGRRCWCAPQSEAKLFHGWVSMIEPHRCSHV